METTKTQPTGQAQTSSNDQQTVFISNPGIMKSYPKTMTPDEINYDAHVNVRGKSPEDYFVNIEPNIALQKAWKTVEPYMKHGQEAMKLFAVRPDVALGLSKDISPEQLAKVYKPWGDIFIENYPAARENNDRNLLKGNYIPWFFSEFIPNELLDFGTKPVNWAAYYGVGKVGEAVERFGPPLINKAISALPEKMRSVLLKDIFKSEVGLAKDFETLGISPNTKTSDVVKAWKSKALETHPDRGGNVDDFVSTRKAYDNIMSARQSVINKMLDKFRSSGSQMDDLKPRLVSLKTANAGQVPIPFNEGDIAKMGSDVVKIAKISGDIATVNLAGKMVQVPLSKLTSNNSFSAQPETKGSTETNIAVGGDSKANPPSTMQELPPENDPNYESAVNLDRMQVSQESKDQLTKATQAISDKIENQSGKPLTHQEVIDKAKESEILTKGVSRESTLNFEAALLKTRQHLASLAEQPELTPEFLDTLKVVANTGTDIARQLGSFRINAMPEYATVKTKVISEIQKLGKSSQEILDAAKGVDFKDQQQVAQFYRKFVKPKASDILNEIAYMNILSSPLTHIVNAFSNALQLSGINPLTKLASGGVDMIASALTGEARKHYVSEVPSFYKGAVNAVPEAVNNAVQALKGKTFVERPDIKNLPTLSPIVDYATLGVGKYVTHALEASDVFFRTLIENGEIEALSNRYNGTPTDKQMVEIKAEAKRRAEYYVFRSPIDPSNKTGQGDILSAIDRMTNAVYGFREVPGARWFIRFVRTPMNILKQGIEYSPAGFATVVYIKLDRRTLIKGSKDTSDQLGKAIIGSIVSAAGYYMAMSGNTTWSIPRGDKEKRFFYQSGRIPYSVKIGDQWVSYSKIGPLAYPLAMASALHYYEKESPDALSSSEIEKAGNAMQSIMEFFSDQSYVQSLGDLVKTLQGDKQSITRLSTSVPTQLIPLVSLQRWVNNIIDPLYRKPSKGMSIESFKDSIKANIVGLRQSLPPQKDIYGKPAENKNRVINAVSPLKTNQVDNNGERILKATKDAKRQVNKQKKRVEDEKKRLGID